MKKITKLILSYLIKDETKMPFDLKEVPLGSEKKRNLLKCIDECGGLNIENYDGILDMDDLKSDLRINIYDLNVGEKIIGKDISIYFPTKREPILNYMLLHDKGGYHIVEIKNRILKHGIAVDFKVESDLKIYLLNEFQNKLAELKI